MLSGYINQLMGSVASSQTLLAYLCMGLLDELRPGENANSAFSTIDRVFPRRKSL